MINIERVISKTPMVIADYFTEDGLLKQVLSTYFSVPENYILNLNGKLMDGLSIRDNPIDRLSS